MRYLWIQRKMEGEARKNQTFKRIAKRSQLRGRDERKGRRWLTFLFFKNVGDGRYGRTEEGGREEERKQKMKEGK